MKRNSPKIHRSRPSSYDLRILSGQFKGTKLTSIANSPTHPMGAREKLALFNMLMPYLRNAKILDLYAGTGALSFEAISLGATDVTAVESNPSAVKIIQQNYQKLADLISLTQSTKQHENSPDNNQINFNLKPQLIRQFCQASLDASDFYDLIIADPPYDAFDLAEIEQTTSLLRQGGIYALSYPNRIYQTPPTLTLMDLLKSKTYAAAGIAIYRKK